MFFLNSFFVPVKQIREKVSITLYVLVDGLLLPLDIAAMAVSHCSQVLC